MEMLSLFAGSALQAISPHDYIRIDLVYTTDRGIRLTHVCLGLLYFTLVKLACLIVVGDMVQESHSFFGTRVEYLDS